MKPLRTNHSAKRVFIPEWVEPTRGRPSFDHKHRCVRNYGFRVTCEAMWAPVGTVVQLFDKSVLTIGEDRGPYAAPATRFVAGAKTFGIKEVAAAKFDTAELQTTRRLLPGEERYITIARQAGLESPPPLALKAGPLCNPLTADPASIATALAERCVAIRALQDQTADDRISASLRFLIANEEARAPKVKEPEPEPCKSDPTPPVQAFEPLTATALRLADTSSSRRLPAFNKRRSVPLRTKERPLRL